ncbi:hypothetical protein ACSZM8_04820 [Aeromonas caviae]
MTSLTHCSVLAMTLVALPALASGDGDGCGFWLTDSPLPPIRSISTRTTPGATCSCCWGMPSITPSPSPCRRIR